MKKRAISSDSEILRKKAENQLRKRIFRVDANSSEVDVRRLLHELEVHQIELEMQNEELMLARERLAATATEKYKELYDFAPTAYFTISKEGHIRELNLRGAGMLGQERRLLVNLKLNQFISKATNIIFNDFLQRVFTLKKIETCEVTLSVSPLVDNYVHMTGHVIEDGEQCLLSVIDITERKKAETELKTKMDELTNAYKQLEEYSRNNQELKQFAFISSHELQQPVRTIYNLIQLYEREYSGVIDENAHKYLNMIKDSAKRIYTLINALSDYSKLGQNKTLRLIRFKELIDNAISDLYTTIKAAGAEIHVSEMPVIKAYEIEMHQVFLNLIGNSVKFHTKDSKPIVWITSEKSGDSWKFSISDNGIGISPGHFDRLFTMFQRLHSDESEFEGKGIGLSVCKKIIELHQGRIWAESNPDTGVTFHFTIPELG